MSALVGIPWIDSVWNCEVDELAEEDSVVALVVEIGSVHSQGQQVVQLAHAAQVRVDPVGERPLLLLQRRVIKVIDEMQASLP